MTFNDENHPNPRDNSSGTTLFLKDGPDDETIYIIRSWRAYSSPRGTWSGAESQWQFVDEEKSVYLSSANIHVGESWEDGFTNPAHNVPDSHKRLIREVAAKRYEVERFRKLYLYPFEE